MGCNQTLKSAMLRAKLENMCGRNEETSLRHSFQTRVGPREGEQVANSQDNQTAKTRRKRKAKGGQKITLTATGNRDPEIMSRGKIRPSLG